MIWGGVTFASMLKTALTSRISSDGRETFNEVLFWKMVLFTVLTGVTKYERYAVAPPPAKAATFWSKRLSVTVEFALSTTRPPPPTATLFVNSVSAMPILPP